MNVGAWNQAFAALVRGHGAVFMTKCPIGAREERITERGGSMCAELSLRPRSEIFRSVSAMYGLGRLPISAGVTQNFCRPNIPERLSLECRR